MADLGLLIKKYAKVSKLTRLSVNHIGTTVIGRGNFPFAPLNPLLGIRDNPFKQ